MRALITRVLSASVTVNGALVASIDRGLLVLVGVGVADSPDDVKWLAAKLSAARVFESPEGRAWSRSAPALALPLLLVSQFTLHASLRKAQPDFHRSAKADAARALFDALVATLRAAHGAAAVQTGAFGEMMQVASVNEGPVTLWVDSHNRDFAFYEDGAGDAAAAAPASQAAVPASAAAAERASGAAAAAAAEPATGAAASEA